MYLSPATEFGAAGALGDVPVPSEANQESGPDYRAHLVHGALAHVLQRRKDRLARQPHAERPIDEASVSSLDSDQDVEDLREVTNVVPFGRSRAPVAMLHALQEWEGYVVELTDTQFTARLLDVTAQAAFEEEEADIPYDEISDVDRSKIRLGSIFRWVIGYERSAAGTKKRVSQIVFRDLPAVAKSDLLAAEAWAAKMATAFRR